MNHGRAVFVIASSLLVVSVLVAQSAAGSGSAHRLPTMKLLSGVYGRPAGTVDLRARICLSNGPRALLAVRETRTLHGVRQATTSWSDPLGVDLTRIYPYACVSGYVMSWILKPKLRGPGTYRATIRLRDGYGQWSAPIAFSH
jgi:hypothetical protein